MVITESVAKKFFGKGPALGKILIFPANRRCEVTGVIEDLPDNTHLKYDILVSSVSQRGWAQTDEGILSEAFWNPDIYTYFLFPQGYDVTGFYEKFPTIYEKYYRSFGDRVGGQYVPPTLEPLAEIHFNSTADHDEPQGNMDYIYAFVSIGIFILLLACINYVNLATARSVNRTGEIVIRKVLGNSKGKLFFSILGEAYLLALMALVFAIVLSYCVIHLTLFNELIGKKLELNFWDNTLLTSGTLGITIVIGFFSGVYPAWYIPSMPIVPALKGSVKSQKSGVWLRKSLIIFQFIVSMLVIICAMIMDNQIDYLRNKELGFNKDNVLLIQLQDTTVRNKVPAIKEKLLQYHGIKEAATAFELLGLDGGTQVLMAESEDGMIQKAFSTIYVDEDYIHTMGIEIIRGRDFRKGSQADVHYSFIVNETAAKIMGWKDDVIGKKMKYFHGEKVGQVIGIVKDYNFTSLHNPIEPQVIIRSQHHGSVLHLRLSGENLLETIAHIKDQWSQFDPNHPFEYFFLDEEFNAQYQADETQHQLVGILSTLCIIISLLGLIGLSAFTAGQKIKEIGIRKVLGASVPSILMLFSKDYVKLIVIAFALAVPVANYLIQEWLAGFAYHTTIQWWLFALPGLLVLAISLVVVAFQSLSAARANPVDALRSE